MENKKSKVSLIIVGILLLIVLLVCFGKAFRNTNNDSNTETSDNSNVITSGGTYDYTGENGCITINTTEDIILNLNAATITCTNGPAINVLEADSVTINYSDSNNITATTTESLDGAIYSKADLILEGSGTLNIKSNYDGIVSKDDLTIVSGTYNIEASDDGIRGKDNTVINDGNFKITASSDGIKASNEEESDKGYIIIENGTFEINCGSDAIQAVTSVTIKNGDFNIKTTGNTSDDGIHSNGNVTLNDGIYTISSKDDGIHADGLVEINSGTYNISAGEGIEATYVKINDGTININASDDGINAGNKSDSYSVTVEINGGTITIKMGSGDTDGIDSNGNLYINGGTIDITATSPFDYDSKAEYNGGTIIVNGETTNSITNQMMGGGPMGDNINRSMGGNSRRGIR